MNNGRHIRLSVHQATISVTVLDFAGHKNRRRTLSFLPVLLLTAIALSSCSGAQRTVTCPGAVCSNGSATVSFTLVADTLPANPSILSFKVTILGITLIPTIGTAQNLQPSSPVVDLMRLQSDTAFLGTLTKVPSGIYTVQVSLSSPEIIVRGLRTVCYLAAPTS